MTNRTDDIEKYLADEFQPNDRQAFEQEMAEDAQLRLDVTVMEDMATALKPDSADAFLENLAKAERPYRAKPLYWWLLLLPLIALAFFLWPTAETVIIEKVENPPQEELQEEKAPPNPPTKEVVPPTLSEPPAPPIISPNPPREQTETQPQKPLILAANFTPNALLEAEMRDQLRGGEISLNLATPAPKTTFTTSEQLRFSGELETNLSADEITFRFLLLDNKTENYQDSNYLLEKALALTPTETGFSFDFVPAITLKPGLYYYLLEWEEEETYLKIERFTVKE